MSYDTPPWYGSIFDLLAKKAFWINDNDSQVGKDGNVPAPLEGHFDLFALHKQRWILVILTIDLDSVQRTLIVSEPPKSPLIYLRFSQVQVPKGSWSFRHFSPQDVVRKTLLNGKQVALVFAEVLINTFHSQDVGVQFHFNISIQESPCCLDRICLDALPEHRNELNLVSKHALDINQHHSIIGQGSVVTAALKD
jgi:hypothetical protein